MIYPISILYNYLLGCVMFILIFREMVASFDDD